MNTLKLPLFALLIGAVNAMAQLIPATPLGNWAPGTTVGVVGGIPVNRTKLRDVTLAPYSVDKTGATDAAPGIQAAIGAAASGDVVYLPAGKYQLGSSILMKSNVTLRGSGDSTVILVNPTTKASINAFGSGPFDTSVASSWAPITSGLQKGSTTITVADTSAISVSVGSLIQIAAPNNPGQNDNPVTLGTGGGNYFRRQKAIVTSISATTVTFSPPLCADWSALSCRLAVGTPVTGVGLENFVFDANGTASIFLINMGCAAESWIQGVRLKNSENYTVYMSDSVFCEIRHCYLDKQNRVSGSNGSGFMSVANSALLFEDNIILTSFPAVEVDYGTSGSVFAYNFILNSASSLGIDTNHSPHNEFNLYEGNIVPNMMSDGYFGSNSDETIFRNWITGFDQVLTYTVALKRFTRNYSIIGNILYAPSTTATNDGISLGTPNIGNGSWSGQAPPWADWGGTPGPPGFQEFDNGVASTLTQIGNYSYSSNSIPSNQTLNGTLRKSLFRTAAPVWFGILTWPPFDPTAPNPTVEAIPAGYRYNHGIDPPSSTAPSAPQNLRVQKAQH